MSVHKIVSQQAHATVAQQIRIENMPQIVQHVNFADLIQIMLC